MAPREELLLFRKARRGLPRQELRTFLATLSSKVAGGREFTCLLTDDNELLRLNKQFLGKNYPTDVLSFPSGEESGSLGELAISCERAAEQASQFGHTVADEIKILMLHGVLHLSGLDHETDKGKMAGIERKWRKEFKLPLGLIERVNQ
jgi:probable rRNA maturation factor